MQARKEDGRSKKTTKATPQKPTKTKPTAKTSARLEAVKSVKAPVAAKKTNGTNGHETKKKAPAAPAKNGSKIETKNAKPAKGAPPAAKKAEAKPEPKAKAPKAEVKVDPKAAVVATEAGKSEPVKTNSSFARPSPWSAPVLPPVKVDAAKLEPRPDEGEFKVGETVVYPARGVADIVAVEDKEIGGRRQSFYVLRVHDTEQKILVPVNNAAQIGLRRPISEAQVREIFRILKVTDVPLDTQTWNRRYRGFVEKLATGSVFAVAEVLRDLSRVKIVKDGLSFSERQMLERARGLIVKEIAVARAKPEDAVRQQIEAIFA
jgi:CarD family transcriptional regulator